MGLWYSKDTSIALTPYEDVDHAGCQDTRRSTSGSAQFLGDRLVSWSSKKQKSTAISSTEAEYMDLSGIQDRSILISGIILPKNKSKMVWLSFTSSALSISWQISSPKFAKGRFKFLINKLRMKSMSPETLKSLAEENEE
ncbi:hypothetical protein Tco_1148147 [Tanacetum coccineum]